MKLLLRYNACSICVKERLNVWYECWYKKEVPLSEGKRVLFERVCALSPKGEGNRTKIKSKIKSMSI